MTRTSTKRTRTTTDPSSRRSRQRGVALILVLWTFAAVAVLAAEFARAMHDEAASARNFKESARARFVAMAAVNEAILALQAHRENSDLEDQAPQDSEDPDPIRSLSQGDGQWVEASFRGTPYEVRVIDEAGKLSLNMVDAATLRTVLGNLDLDPDDADAIADSIVDWRDEDDMKQLNGAESEYYEGLERPYRAKNAAFDSIEELLLVRGVTGDIFHGVDDRPGLKELFSVFNQTRTINLRSVTPAVMQALGGIDAETAANYGQQRRGTSGQATIDELRATLAGSGAGARDAAPQQMTIEARVRDASGQVVLAHVGAVINLSSSGDGLRVFRWYDSIFDDSDETPAAAAGEDTPG